MSEPHELATSVKLSFFTGFIEVDGTIYFEVSHWGFPGSRDEPPSGPEFDIISVHIDEIQDTIPYESFDTPSQNNIDQEIEEYVCSGRLQYDILADREDQY